VVKDRRELFEIVGVIYAIYHYRMKNDDAFVNEIPSLDNITEVNGNFRNFFAGGLNWVGTKSDH
jgi:hypothetical protein